MFRFWDSIIHPVFQALKPSKIVEIGASHGHNTIKILNYCRDHGACLHSIDPMPRFSPEHFKQEFNDRFIFHETTSLQALGTIDQIDIALIDGDHNWYTVYNELQMMTNRSGSKDLPVIFCHDTSWPYGRRDLYYNPEDIPEEYRQPYHKKGLDPDSSELLENGGLSPHLCNAVSENNARNGVLTAIEDFLKTHDQDCRLLLIPSFFGLAMIYPTDLQNSNRDFDRILGKLSLSEEIKSLMLEQEKSRIKTIINKQNIESQAEQFQRETATLGEDLDNLTQKLKINLEREQRLYQKLNENRQKKSEMDTRLEKHDYLIKKLATNFQDLVRSRRWTIGNNAGKIFQSFSRDKKEFRAPLEIKNLLEELQSDELYPFSKEIITEKKLPSPQHLTISSSDRKPLISVIVNFFNMRREARRTLLSLTTQYQHGVNTDDYEVIVLDSGSDNPLDREWVESIQHNVRYFYVNARHPSPCEALNQGIETASADFVLLMIDGARLLSPGILSLILKAKNAFANPFIYTLGFHIGSDLQNKLVEIGYNQQAEDKILDHLGWETDGYRLFDCSVVAGSSKDGYLNPISESNCFAIAKNEVVRLGGFDERFTSKGGGLVNLDLFTQLIQAPHLQPVMLLGEGTFHQFHGGVATNVSHQDHPMQEYLEEYKRIRGYDFKIPEQNPYYLGRIHDKSKPFLDTKS